MPFLHIDAQNGTDGHSKVCDDMKCSRQTHCLVVMAERPHLFPCRTQSLSSPAPMVVGLTSRQSRTLPGNDKDLIIVIRSFFMVCNHCFSSVHSVGPPLYISFLLINKISLLLLIHTFRIFLPVYTCLFLCGNIKYI